MEIIASPHYELAMNLIAILNVFTVFLRALQQSATEENIKMFIYIELSINFLMLIEYIMDIAISGCAKAF